MSDELPVPTDPVPPPLTPWYEDKAVHAVLTFVVGMVANVVGRKWGYSLNVEEIVAFAAVTISFIGAHKWKSKTLTAQLYSKGK